MLFEQPGRGLRVTTECNVTLDMIETEINSVNGHTKRALWESLFLILLCHVTDQGDLVVFNEFLDLLRFGIALK